MHLCIYFKYIITIVHTSPVTQVVTIDGVREVIFIDNIITLHFRQDEYRENSTMLIVTRIYWLRVFSFLHISYTLFYIKFVRWIEFFKANQYRSFNNIHYWWFRKTDFRKKKKHLMDRKMIKFLYNNIVCHWVSFLYIIWNIINKSVSIHLYKNSHII